MATLAEKRKPSQKVAKPAQRYRPGQIPKEAQSDSEESDGEGGEEDGDEEHVKEEQGDDEQLTALDTVQESTPKPTIGISSSVRNIDVGGVKEEEEADADVKPKVEESGSEEEEESSEEESSEEEAPPPPRLKPTFVPKRARETVLQQQKESQDSEEAQRKREAAEEERKQASIDLVADSIRRELAESV